MNYKETIELLTSSEKFHIDLGLERVEKALEILGNPQDSLKCIHVAGTNGKGSVCAILNSILFEAGYKVGMYTSPHIFEYTERIKTNNQDISQDDFAKLVENVCNTEIPLTEFEILTVMAFLYFKEQNVDYVILETGLGGRLDATNVIKENLCSIITHIDLDHTDRLGDTKEKIAYEKAGIIKKNCPVVTSMGFETIKDKADKEGSMLIFTSPFVQKDFVEALSLKGLHQTENLALALSAIEYLFPDISYNTIINGLKKVKNPCRFEFFKDKNLIIDACHNPNGAEALRQNLDFYYPDLSRRFVFGALKRKDYTKMMEILFRENDEIYFNEFDYEGACTFEELKNACKIKTVQKYTPDVELSKDKLNIICGSFYMLKEILHNS